MAGETVWGLDIGQCALKAVRARAAGQLAEVLAFDHIEYRQPLSTAGTDSSATIREALQTFLSRNDVEGSSFAVSIAAGRSALIRFIKLPPVDRKKVPDIVRYEATQQIPFPLEDVVWDHQVIDRVYGPGEELEVGIFAMRREAIFDFLSNLMVSGIEVENIQLSAVALYNCVHFDQPVEEGAIMAVDIGAENTNLVVVEGNNVWTRSLPIGGNDFTRAIATKYGLDFAQAEQLKRSMDRSKKAPEIFEALRPSLRSLLDEIQRSAGYYRSVHKSAKFVKLIGFGNGFKMYGVQRFLEAGLAYPVEVFQKTNNFVVDAAANQQFFKKSAPAFGAALGLAAQSLGFGGVNTTLMPPAIIQERILKKKRPMLIAAAILLAGAFVWPAASAYTKPVAYDVLNDPINKVLKDKLAEQAQYDKLLDTKAMKAEMADITELKSMRTEQLAAFDAFLKGLPNTQETPYYIKEILMDSGASKWVAERLAASKVKAEEATVGGKKIGLVGTKVVRPDIIGTTFEETKRAATNNSSGLSPEELAERREAAIAAREMREDMLHEKMAARFSDGAKPKPKAAAPSKRLESKMANFAGVAQMARVTIEIPGTAADAFVKAFCAKMREEPGVMYCDCVDISPKDVWEDAETAARQYSPPREADSTFKRVAYSEALIQWVYKEGSTTKIVAGDIAEAAAAATAATAKPGARAAAKPEAPAAVKPEAPGAPEAAQPSEE